MQVDAETGEVIGELPILARIEVGNGFGRVAVGDDVWVLNSTDQTLSRIDTASSTVSDTYPFDGGADPGDLALVSGDAWVTDPAENVVSRVDASSGDVVQSWPSESLPSGLVEADGDLWVANHHGQPSGSVWRIDPDTNEVVARIPVGSLAIRGPQWMAATAGSVWVGVPNLNAVVRIDTQANAVVATIPVPDGGVCGQLIAQADAVWVAPGFCGDGSLTRIDPATNTVVARIESPLWDVAFGGTLGFDSLWLSTDVGVFEVDPSTDAVASRLTLDGYDAFGGDMAADSESLWVHDGLNAMVFRIAAPD